MRLRALKFFNEDGLQVEAGAVVDVPTARALYLLDSWAGSWEFYYEPAPEVQTEAVDAPEVDKMIHKPVKAKRRTHGNN